MSERSKDIEASSPPNEAAVLPLADNKRKVFFGLFVFPMLIAVTMAVLLSGIVLLTHEEETPETLITTIKTGAPSKRWQKAFELSNELNRKDGMIRGAGIMHEVIHILNDKEHYDAKTRAYMAMALSRFQNDEAEAALRKALRGADDSEDPKLTLFLMWSIGNFKHPDAAQDVVRFLESQHDDLRKTAAYVLGALAYGTRYVAGQVRMGNSGPVPAVPGTVLFALKRSLEDPVVDVQWNAAASLARLGDNSGGEILLQMLDRNRLQNTQRLNEVEIERVMVNAAKAFGLIQYSEAAPVLEKVSKTDPNLKVRETALIALRQST